MTTLWWNIPPGNSGILAVAFEGQSVSMPSGSPTCLGEGDLDGEGGVEEEVGVECTCYQQTYSQQLSWMESLSFKNLGIFLLRKEGRRGRARGTMGRRWV